MLVERRVLAVFMSCVGIALILGVFLLWWLK
jgi:hypothetical protein